MSEKDDWIHKLAIDLRREFPPQTTDKTPVLVYLAAMKETIQKHLAGRVYLNQETASLLIHKKNQLLALEQAILKMRDRYLPASSIDQPIDLPIVTRRDVLADINTHLIEPFFSSKPA